MRGTLPRRRDSRRSRSRTTRTHTTPASPHSSRPSREARRASLEVGQQTRSRRTALAHAAREKTRTRVYSAQPLLFARGAGMVCRSIPPRRGVRRGVPPRRASSSGSSGSTSCATGLSSPCRRARRERRWLSTACSRRRNCSSSTRPSTRSSRDLAEIIRDIPAAAARPRRGLRRPRR